MASASMVSRSSGAPETGLIVVFRRMEPWTKICASASSGLSEALRICSSWEYRSLIFSYCASDSEISLAARSRKCSQLPRLVCSLLMDINEPPGLGDPTVVLA